MGWREAADIGMLSVLLAIIIVAVVWALEWF